MILSIFWRRWSGILLTAFGAPHLWGMKNKVFLSAAGLALVVFFAACSGGGAKGGSAAAATGSGSGSGDSTYSGDNSFSFQVNGRKVAIKDYMHKGDGKNYIALYRNKVANDPATGLVSIEVTNELSSEVFNLNITNSGTTKVLHYGPSLATFADKKTKSAEYMSPKYKNYYGDEVTVTITAVDATHVAGTFSGKYLSDDKEPMDITDGQFDLQITKPEAN
jgi:hypothetical protein